MAKGYWIVGVEVTDPDGYKEYVAANAVAFQKYGARFIVRGGRFEAPEGTPRSRNVVLEFKDYETALACYRSPEYAAAKRAPRRTLRSEPDYYRGLRRLDVSALWREVDGAPPRRRYGRHPVYNTKRWRL